MTEINFYIANDEFIDGLQKIKKGLYETAEDLMEGLIEEIKRDRQMV